MLVAVCLVLGGLASAPPAVADKSPAETVPFDHWAYDAVQKLVDAGIIIGDADYDRQRFHDFHGDRFMTRYEFAMAISRLMDSPAVGSMPVPSETPGRETYVTHQEVLRDLLQRVRSLEEQNRELRERLQKLEQQRPADGVR
jgi:hypothetical protein